MKAKGLKDAGDPYCSQFAKRHIEGQISMIGIKLIQHTTAWSLHRRSAGVAGFVHVGVTRGSICQSLWRSLFARTACFQPAIATPSSLPPSMVGFRHVHPHETSVMRKRHHQRTRFMCMRETNILCDIYLSEVFCLSDWSALELPSRRQ